MSQAWRSKKRQRTPSTESLREQRPEGHAHLEQVEADGLVALCADWSSVVRDQVQTLQEFALTSRQRAWTGTGSTFDWTGGQSGTSSWKAAPTCPGRAGGCWRGRQRCCPRPSAGPSGRRPHSPAGASTPQTHTPTCPPHTHTDGPASCNTAGLGGAAAAPSPLGTLTGGGACPWRRRTREA